MFHKHSEHPKFFAWRNQDGSSGGQVSVNAKVHSTAVVERYAIVLAGAEVGEQECVSAGEIRTRSDVYRLEDSAIKVLTPE